MKKRVRTIAIGAMGIGILLISAIAQPTMTAYAAEAHNNVAVTQQEQQVTQSPRWEGQGDEWRVKDGKGGYLRNTWYQDEVTGHWYMLGAGDGTLMYSGLVTDQSTGKSYLLHTLHDGTYGRMVDTDGVYTINGKQVYLTFDQGHTGTHGAITSGLSELRSTGINESRFSAIPIIPNEIAETQQQQAQTSGGTGSTAQNNSNGGSSEGTTRKPFNRGGIGEGYVNNYSGNFKN